MIDYEKKARLLDEGLPRLQKQVGRSLYVHLSGRTETPFTLPLNEAIDLDIAMSQYRSDDWAECKKINRAEYVRSCRLYHRIREMVQDGAATFITLTFSPERMGRTSRQTRRDYVRKYLRALNVPYVANIDYGGENGREHYHAVIASQKLNYKLWHKNGGLDGEKVRCSDLSSKKMGKYISKLTNHAIKATARACRVIYSRNTV